MKTRVWVALSLVLLAALSLVLPLEAVTPQHPTPPDDPSGSGCYCSVDHCGCASPPVGWYLIANYSCGISCSRSCDYYQL